MKIISITDDKMIDEVFCLVKRVFNAFIAPGYTEEGVKTFFDIVTPQYIKSLYDRNGFVLAAVEDEKVIGTIAVRDRNYITLLFIDSQFHKRGIGSKLLHEAIPRIKMNGSEKAEVHAAPLAATWYESMGFTKVAEETVEKGIRYVPLELAFV